MKRKPTVGPPPPPGAKQPRAKTQGATAAGRRPKTNPKVDDDSTPFEEIDELAIEALDPHNRSGVVRPRRPDSRPRARSKADRPAPAAPPPAQSRWVTSARAIGARVPSIESTLDSFDGPSQPEGQAFDTEDFGKIEPETSGTFEMSAEDIAALRGDAPLEPQPLERAESLAEEQIAELPEVPVLRVAICETHGHLAAGQGAIVAAGHAVAVAAAGVDGAARVMDAIRRTDVDVVIVALPGAGDGRGGVETQVIDAALALEPRRPIIVASVPGTAVDGVRRAHQAGADLVTLRPHDVDRLAPVLLAAARLAHARGRLADAHGTTSMLRDKLEQLSQPDGGLVPLEMFQRMLETEIKRARRYEYPLAVAMFAVDIDEPPPPGVRGILRARIGNVLVRTIRDIDVATQLDHERFFVLLPYTDLSGAANLARRVIDSIRIGDAVVVGDRAFPPRVVGAVAGASPGQVMSFSKLVRDASRALDQARADGAELAVQP